MGSVSSTDARLRIPEWQLNIHWKELPTLGVGDIAQLKFGDASEFVAKTIVSDVGEVNTARVEGIFTTANGSPVIGGDFAALAGSIVTFPKHYVHCFIKRAT